MAEIWIIAVALCVIAEVITNAYAALFVGLGALFGFLSALIGLSLLIQIVLALGISAAGLVLVRPMALADISRSGALSRAAASGSRVRSPQRSARAERVGVVETMVGDENHPGRVLLDGRLYHAVTDYPRDLPDGTTVIVRGSQHGTLWVDPY